MAFKGNLSLSLSLRSFLVPSLSRLVQDLSLSCPQPNHPISWNNTTLITKLRPDQTTVQTYPAHACVIQGFGRLSDLIEWFQVDVRWHLNQLTIVKLIWDTTKEKSPNRAHFQICYFVNRYNQLECCQGKYFFYIIAFICKETGMLEIRLWLLVLFIR